VSDTPEADRLAGLTDAELIHEVGMADGIFADYVAQRTAELVANHFHKLPATFLPWLRAISGSGYISTLAMGYPTQQFPVCPILQVVLLPNGGGLEIMIRENDGSIVWSARLTV
jgi:hypothetical protein